MSYDAPFIMIVVEFLVTWSLVLLLEVWTVTSTENSRVHSPLLVFKKYVIGMHVCRQNITMPVRYKQTCSHFQKLGTPSQIPTGHVRSQYDGTINLISIRTSYLSMLHAVIY